MPEEKKAPPATGNIGGESDGIGGTSPLNGSTPPVKEKGRNRGRLEHGFDDSRALSDAHFQKILKPRGITEAQAERRGYFSTTGAAQIDALGFAEYQARPSLAIPLWNAERVWGHQLRPDTPRVEKRANGKERCVKYELAAGKPVEFDIAPGSAPLDDPRAVIWFTEGPLKADALRCAGADIAIGLFGVHGYRHPAVMAFLDRQRWDGRQAVIAFDSDTATNGQVGSAAWNIGQHLSAKGAAVKWLALTPDKDGDKRGVDDILGAGGTLADLLEMVHPHPELFKLKRRTGPNGELLPLIIANANRPFDERVYEAAGALVDANSPEELFIRGGSLVHLVGDEGDRVRTASVGEHYARVLLSEAADFVTVGEKKGVRYAAPVSPPKDISQAVQELPNIGVPRIVSLTFGPTLRPDFTINSKPGYDAATETYRVGEEFELDIPEKPTQADALAARLRLLELAHDFGLDPASRENVLSMLITAVIRAAIQGLCPGFGINKAVVGEGGTLLSDLPALIATGRQLPRKSFIRDNESSMRQAIISTLQDGDPLTGFDNADGRVSSEALEVALTAPEIEERAFHKQTNLIVPNRAVMIVNGIAFEPTGGLLRRFVPIVLRSGIEYPDRRDPADFKFPNLLNHVMKHRAEYLSHIFTMALAWHEAGRPKAKDLPAFASYETWRDMLGGIIQFAGGMEFLANLHEFRDSHDEDGDMVRALFTDWWAADRDSKLTTAEIVSRIDSSEHTAKWPTVRLSDIMPLLGEGKGDPARRMPYLLRRLAGRVVTVKDVGPVTLTVSTNHKTMKVWALTRSDTPTQPQGLMPKAESIESFPYTAGFQKNKNFKTPRVIEKVSGVSAETTFQSQNSAESAESLWGEDVDEALEQAERQRH